MRFFLGLLILLSIESYAQTEKLDTLTYHQLIEDLFLADDPFDYPSLSSLVVERKQKRNSPYPKKEKIKLLNGRTVAKYEYELKDGILVSRKLKAQSMTPGSWLTANYYYSDSGKVLSTVVYRLFDSDLLELTRNMPQTWIAGRDSKGNTIPQKLVLSYGQIGC